MKNKHALYCRDYRINRAVNEFTTIDVRFFLPVGPNESEETAEALKNIELLLWSEEGVNLVRGAERPRCPWCGVLHDEDHKTCPQCGGAL